MRSSMLTASSAVCTVVQLKARVVLQEPQHQSLKGFHDYSLQGNRSIVI